MPFVMGDFLQSVVLQGKVYVGGGIAGLGSNNNNLVMKYDIGQTRWGKLAPYRACYFAMTTIKDLLVLVGGEEQGEVNKVVGVWDAVNKKWTHPYPEMPTARSHCSTAVHNEWLVVAGGVSTTRGPLSSLEIMNSNNMQWYAGFPTPKPWSHMKSAVVGDTCYFMGGLISKNPTEDVYAVSLSALISGLNSNDPSMSGSHIWKEIPGLPLTSSTPFPVTSRSLLAVGGRVSTGENVSTILLYRADTKRWVKIGDLPGPRRSCTCAVITDRELLVTGGYNTEMLKMVNIAKIKN